MVYIVSLINTTYKNSLNNVIYTIVITFILSAKIVVLLSISSCNLVALFTFLITVIKGLILITFEIFNPTNKAVLAVLISETLGMRSVR